MATVTCTTPGCGASLAPNDLLCPKCGGARTGGLNPAGGQANSGQGNSPADGSRKPHLGPNTPPSGGACSHQACGPGAIICPTCGATVDGGPQVPRPPARRFRLRSPWGEWVVVESELEIGRDVGPLSDNLTGHTTISRRHASLLITTSGRLHVIDHNSTNGTFRNDRRIDANLPVELQAGDTVSFSSAVRFEVDEDAGEQ